MLSGLFLSEGTGKVYPLFVAPKPGVTDQNLFTVDGTLSYDQRKRVYAISQHNPYDPDMYEGSVLTLQDSTGALNFRGKFNLINSNKDYTLHGGRPGLCQARQRHLRPRYLPGLRH